MTRRVGNPRATSNVSDPLLPTRPAACPLPSPTSSESVLPGCVQDFLRARRPLTPGISHPRCSRSIRRPREHGRRLRPALPNRSASLGHRLSLLTLDRSPFAASSCPVSVLRALGPRTPECSSTRMLVHCPGSPLLTLRQEVNASPRLPLRGPSRRHPNTPGRNPSSLVPVDFSDLRVLGASSPSGPLARDNAPTEVCHRRNSSAQNRPRRRDGECFTGNSWFFKASVTSPIHSSSGRSPRPQPPLSGSPVPSPSQHLRRAPLRHNIRVGVRSMRGAPQWFRETLCLSPIR